jgi:hypothetical protein
MIYLEKNTSNKVVLTLSQTSTLPVPYFLFEFIYEGNTSPVNIYWTGDDETLAYSRYSLFTIDENSSGSTTGTTGSLSLMVGQYAYNIYESSTSNPSSISDTTGVVIQTGRMVVADPSGEYVDQIIPSQNNTNSNIYL